MQPEKNNLSDLEYLAGLGFEKVPAGPEDFKGLTERLKKRSKAPGRNYFSAGALLLGIGIGAGLFFVFDPKPEPGKATAAIVKAIESPEPAGNAITLDTVTVGPENFIKPAVNEKMETEVTAPAPEASVSAEVIIPKPLDLSLLKAGDIKEEKLKYMINAPVFYLHDMKITSYTTLYFKKNRFVKYTGLPASYSGTNEPVSGTALKQEPEYYLHEEIATAMLHFKKGRYDQAINSLKMIATYNKEDLNCNFYLAMCYYYKKNYTGAIELLDLCISSPNTTFVQESQYYKALALFESDRKEEAKILFREIATENEFYGEKARAYLK